MLWERLEAQAPVRGLDRPIATGGLLVAAAWPTADPARVDPELEADLALAQAVVREVRDVRNKYNVAPRTPLEVRIKAPEGFTARIEPLRAHVVGMAALSALEVAAEVERAATAATRVVGEAEISVLGVLDLDKERARLDKHRAELEGQIRSSEARLSNPGFATKAPAAVVEAARARLEELKGELERVAAALAALES